MLEARGVPIAHHAINHCYMKTVSLVSVLCGFALLGSATPFAALAATGSLPSRLEHSRLQSRELLLAGRLQFTVRGVGSSRDRVSGISRGGSCNLDETAVRLTTLSPKRANETPNSPLSVESTVSDHPAFFVYVPQTQAETAQFILSDENQNTIYQTTFTPPPQAGVIGLQVPPEIPALQIGSTYHWLFNVQCDPYDRSGDLLVEGWIQRVELTPAQVSFLARTGVRDRPAFYARAGIWQDTLLTLATLRLASPDDADLTSDWASLLESVNLSAVATAPLININLKTLVEPTTCRCNSTP